MANHVDDENAKPLFDYFSAVIEWVKKLFPNYRKPMKGVDWGSLYRTYGNRSYDAGKIEEEVSKLMADSDEVGNQKGIYEYVFDHEKIPILDYTLDDIHGLIESQNL